MVLIGFRQQKKIQTIAKLVEKNKSKFAGKEIAGKKLGVIGLGAIGVFGSKRLRIVWVWRVYGYDPFISVDSAWNLSEIL